ncbi:unnamed protein product [Symbiodinium sp. CCMP2456]|nr:unnamed protein product [Symbiodinium sp. CCMP2456]
MDMNHVHLTLWQYLWAAHCIALPAFALVVCGWCQMQLARLLSFCGLLPEASEAKVRRMLLGLSRKGFLLRANRALLLRAFCNGLWKLQPRIYHLVLENLCTGVASIDDTEGHNVATFAYSPFPMYVDCDDCDDCDSKVRFEVKKRMVVKLDLETKDFLTAELDGETLALMDAAVLLTHCESNVNHGKMHAYANWGIDPADSTSPYLQKMSVVTACYNHYGFTNFPRMASNLVHKDAGPAVEAVLVESLNTGVAEHRLVAKLAEHSRLLKFMIQLRVPFRQAFNHCRADFPANYSCEAHYLGTVVHSLDHWAFCQHVDPWLFSALTPSKHLQTLHRTVLLARCCAVDDIPTLGLEKYFRDGSTEFHRMVYQAAKDLDVNFADQIQTCIVR